MKNTEALAREISQLGILDFFAVTGGAALNLIDALVETGGLNPYFHHHEQAAALAADAYARINGLGLCVVTTGPGVTNALTGLLCSWQDSVPCIYISGQARSNFTAQGRDVRQVGTQHLEVIPIVSKMTKRAHLLKTGESIADVIQELAFIAQDGRPGPVWLDIPLDVQLAEAENRAGTRIGGETSHFASQHLELVPRIIDQLSESRRPILLLGRGVKSISHETLRAFIAKLGIPVLRTWGFHDTEYFFANENDFGAIGVSGQRGANLVMSEADFVLSIGSRLSQAVTGPVIKNFAPKAQKVIVEIESVEIERLLDFEKIESINTNSKDFILEMLKYDLASIVLSSSWKKYCTAAKSFNSEQIRDQEANEKIDLYSFLVALDDSIQTPTTFVIDGGGTIVYSSMQVFNPKKNRRIVIPSASAPMGTGLPHSIGVKVAKPQEAVILFCGDGSFPFNMQELQTLKTYNLEIRIIVLNNSGYLSIRQSQDQFLSSRHLGSDESGSLILPSISRVASAFEIDYSSIQFSSESKQEIEKLLTSSGLAILEVFISDKQPIYPTLGFHPNGTGGFSPAPLSDMFPFRTDLPTIEARN